MKLNMGIVDRGIRILAAGVLAILFYLEVLTGIPGIIAMVVAGIFVITSVVGFCPLYAVLGVRTCPLDSSKEN